MEGRKEGDTFHFLLLLLLLVFLYFELFSFSKLVPSLVNLFEYFLEFFLAYFGLVGEMLVVFEVHVGFAVVESLFLLFELVELLLLFDAFLEHLLDHIGLLFLMVLLPQLVLSGSIIHY